MGENSLEDLDFEEDLELADEPEVSVTLFEGYEIDAKSERARGVVASMLDSEIEGRLSEGTRNYLEAGYFLHVMKDSGAYKSLGDHIKTWADYLSDKGISVATDNNLRGIATIFGKALASRPELLKADYKRLTEVLTLFRTNPDALERYKQKVLARPRAAGEPVEIEAEVVTPADDSPEPAAPEVIDVDYVDVTEEQLKEQILFDAVSLPKKGWVSQLKEIKGETPPDACGHDGAYDVLHRCRACGQLYSPEEGHTDAYNVFNDMSEDELIKVYKGRVQAVDGDRALNNTTVVYDKRRSKFFVNHATKSPDGVWGKNMAAEPYERKGFINLIISKAG